MSRNQISFGFSLLRKYNIPTAPFIIVSELSDLPKDFLTFPLVLKACLLEHKSELGAVKIVYNREELEKGFEKLRKKFRVPILVQKFVEGFELIIGAKQDPIFGSLVMVGEGGIFTEYRKDISFRLAPISKKEALEMIKEINFYSVLKGFRGRKANLNLLAKVVSKVSELSFREKIELDINPFILNEKEGYAVDVRVAK